MKRTNRSPNDQHVALSLFSGAGGMDLGVQQAGFRVLAQVEADPHCCATLRAAVDRGESGATVVESDIRKLDPRSLMAQLGVRAGKLDLLFGGPPCQSFSLAGKQLGLSDARGLLLFEMSRFARVFKPRVVLLEQVKGLLSSRGPSNKKGEVFELFLKDLEEAGYTPKWKVLCAADYGVPQMRERLFIVATRESNGYSFPDRTHAPESEKDILFKLPKHVVVGDVLGGLRRPTPKVPGTTLYDVSDSHVDVTPARDRERIAQVPEGSYLAAQTHLSVDLRKNLSPKDTTKYLRLHRKRPCNTLRCGEIFYHPTSDRYLTPREYMRIHGYPDEYVLRGPIRSRTGAVRNLDQHRQVANSVPPPLARALAASILDYLNE